MKTRFTMTAVGYGESIRHIFCMSLQDFIDVFGQAGGEYQWTKFTADYKKDVGRWVTYLDNDNLAKLFAHLAAYLHECGAEYE